MKRFYKRVFALVLCLVLVAALMPPSVFAHVIGEWHNTGDVVPGKVVVGLKEPFYGDIAELFPELDMLEYEDIYLSVVQVSKKTVEEVNETIREMIGTTFEITLSEDTVEAVEKAVNLLENNPYIKYVNPDRYLELLDTIPNDPYYAPATGTPQWGLEKIGAPEAWDYITGSDMTDGSELNDYVKVAVMDTGIDDQHVDLVDNINISLAYNAYLEVLGNTSDALGHGTHVAGIIGAKGNNEIGVVGVCWNVEIIPIKIAYEDVHGYSTSTIMTKAINYANTNEIMISNLSYTVSNNNELITAVQQYSNSGGLLVISAGNDGDDIDVETIYQALDAISGVMLVGALKYDISNDEPLSWSNYGDTVVDLFAPGQSIMSTVPNNNYSIKSGTSMAAPFVTGTAALIKSANTGYINTTIKKRILDNVTTSSNLTNYCSTGGRLNIPDALYDMGYKVIISNTMTHGTVRPSAIFTKPNTIVYLTAYPDAGYMLKPGTMKHNSNNTITVNKWRTFFAMPYSNDTITAQFYMVGDIDFDEAITVADALAALRHCAGNYTLTGDAFLAADVDGDGDVDLTDAQTIQSFAAHMIDHFPIEE